MLTERDLRLLEATRRRHAARHARERAKSIVRKDRRPDTLAAGRAHRAMLKLYARADAELRVYELHPSVASITALSALGAQLRHAVDDVRTRSALCAGSPAADAMRLRMREDASTAMRVVRRIDAALRSVPAPSPEPAALPKLDPITPPPIPVQPEPLYYEPDPNAPPEVRRSEYYWEKLVRSADGSLAEWQAQRKAAREDYLKSEKGKEARAAAIRRYLQSDKGKAAHAAAIRRYLQSEKGKAATKRYLESEKGKEARKRYAQSEKGKEARRRYLQSEKGKEALKRAQAAYRAKKSSAATQTPATLDLFSLDQSQH